MKFKTGDIIKGLPASNSKYSWINEKMTKAEVIRVNGDSMDIKILKHKSESQIGQEYDVINSDEYFELVTEVGKDNNDLKELENERKKLENAVDLPKVYSINPQKRTTALIFPNGTKTVVKKAEDDEFNPRLAFLTAFFQHYCGMTKNKANKYLASLEVEEPREIKKEILVKVSDLGGVYSTYEEFMDINFPKYKENWKRGENPKRLGIYKLIGKEKHECFSDIVALIQDRETKQVYLIEENSIKEVKK